MLSATVLKTLRRQLTGEASGNHVKSDTTSRVHSAQLAHEFPEQHDMTAAPSYSPDIAPRDSRPYPRLEGFFRAIKFNLNPEVRQSVEVYLEHLAEKSFLDAYRERGEEWYRRIRVQRGTLFWEWIMFIFLNKKICFLKISVLFSIGHFIHVYISR